MQARGKIVRNRPSTGLMGVRWAYQAGRMSSLQILPRAADGPGAWRRVKDTMGPLVDRTEFRAVLKEVVNCVREHLDAPGITPLNPEQIMFWLQNVTLEDLEIVVQEIDADTARRGEKCIP